MNDDEDEAWQRYDAAGDGGDGLPPDGELRGPIGDPRPECPIVCLGGRDGVYHFLDARGEHRALTARQLGSRSEQSALFCGDLTWRWRYFPKLAKQKVAGGESRLVVVGYSVVATAEWLLAECSHEPIFGAQVVIRRAGVWQGETGEPVAHCGDELLIDDRWLSAGLRTGNIVWVADSPVARPGEACGVDVARYIQQQLQEYWTFRYGGGAIAYLGVLGSAYLGAVSRWRPNVFLGGSPGTGKSKLLDAGRAMMPLHNYTTDTTKAGLEQAVTGRAMPSFIDEASDQQDQRGAQTLLNLTLASTGDEGAKVARGTADGAGRSSSVLGSFIMASVAPPEMQPQHWARVVLVDLISPEAGEDHLAQMDALIAYCREQGPALWRRAIVGFKRYHLALAVFRDALGRTGCAPRQMDQLGAILAGWWILTDDGVPDDREAINGVAAIADFRQSADEIANLGAGRQVAEHLATSRLEGDRSSEKWPVAEMCLRVWETRTDPESGERIGDLDNSWQDRLGRNGMRAVRADQLVDRRSGRQVARGGPGDGLWIAYRSAPVLKLFAETGWAGQRWRFLLRGLPSVKEAASSVRIGDINVRCAVWISRADLTGEE
ncbi:MAG: ATP-binding protein [Acetobacteraceae bacterium]